MRHRTIRVLLLLVVLGSALTACGVDDASTKVTGLLGQSNALYVPDLLAKAQEYNGKTVAVDGAYVGRGSPDMSVLALGVSTLDNGLDAQPVGDPIWLDGFPQNVT